MYDAKRMNEVLIPSSGKMVLLDKLLPKLKREGHKVLLYDLKEQSCLPLHYRSTIQYNTR